MCVVSICLPGSGFMILNGRGLPSSTSCLTSPSSSFKFSSNSLCPKMKNEKKINFTIKWIHVSILKPQKWRKLTRTKRNFESKNEESVSRKLFILTQSSFKDDCLKKKQYFGFLSDEKKRKFALETDFSKFHSNYGYQYESVMCIMETVTFQQTKDSFTHAK